MLWLTGIVSVLKGMVRIPNVVNLPLANAQSQISDSHLTNTGNTTENTGDTNLGTKVKSQSPSADTLVDYETNVSLVSYVFSFTPFSVFSFTPAPIEGRNCTPIDFGRGNCGGPVGSCTGESGSRCFV
jgi:hypothetical protein